MDKLSKFTLRNMIMVVSLLLSAINVQAFENLGMEMQDQQISENNLNTDDFQEVSGDGQEAFHQYAELVHQYEEAYGKPQLLYPNDFSDMLTGLCFIKLVDFKQDGDAELLLVYEDDDDAYVLGKYTFEIWSFEDESLSMLDSGELFGTDGGIWSVILTEYEGKQYLVTGGADSFSYNYYHGYGEEGFGIVREAIWDEEERENNKWVQVFSIDGVNVSEEQWWNEENVWQANAHNYLMNGVATEETLAICSDTKRQLGIIEENNSGEMSNQLTAEYIFPNSDSVYLTSGELQLLSSKELQYARNEIYARRGRTFKNEELQSYFLSKSWYVPQYSPEEFDAVQEQIFNDVEKANIELIRSVEVKRENI